MHSGEFYIHFSCSVFDMLLNGVNFVRNMINMKQADVVSLIHVVDQCFVFAYDLPLILCDCKL